ncbi:hypothetical protein CBR_g52011 [Chara braunii]|uniref:mRNA (guanine-N(7))-methyltransferase n=1 Tax=Chara braunii TaxID=69332 RepID=A0A388K6N3_CHABU|nr:hypothetical protein CBR_g52011 [Chara braunii]|eukprot:GBG65710.1 hypothetical protein CBR_g52011 [Chara braunii]
MPIPPTAVAVQGRRGGGGGGGGGGPPSVGGMALIGQLLEWVKRVMIAQLVRPNDAVCDVFCGRGLDCDKLADTKIGRYLGLDLSASALKEAQEEWRRAERSCVADFKQMDPCMDCFHTEDRLHNFLRNAAALLKPGGYLFGTCPDSGTIWCKYQKAVESLRTGHQPRWNGQLPRVRSDSYTITFEDDR